MQKRLENSTFSIKLSVNKFLPHPNDRKNLGQFVGIGFAAGANAII